MNNTLGLYVHIPFCRSKCAYCDFYSLAREEERMAPYVRALTRQLTGAAPSAAGRTVDTVYFGGGTPSLLGSEALCALLGTIRTHYSVAEDAEITLEANPDSAQDVGALRALRQAGFNRISLGMQSADDGELREIGRIHTLAQVRSAVAAARTAGFENLSLDLIYGLPHQTMARWQANLAEAAALAPQHLSCYGLKVEPGTPLYLRRDTAGLPDDEAQADFYLRTVEYLAQRGYEQYEISNFARRGFASRHNLRYWELKEYLGFGPGAHSDFGGERFAWARDLNGYLRGAEQGVFPTSERSAISPAERAAERVMLGLRTAAGIDPVAGAEDFWQRCCRAGYGAVTDGRWHLTPRGFLLSNRIIVGLEEYL